MEKEWLRRSKERKENASSTDDLLKNVGNGLVVDFQAADNDRFPQLVTSSKWPPLTQTTAGAGLAHWA